MPGLLSRSISALRAAVWLGFQAALPCAFNAAFIAAVASDGRNKTKINEILRCAGGQCALVPWRLGSFALPRGHLPACRALRERNGLDRLHHMRCISSPSHIARRRGSRLLSHMRASVRAAAGKPMHFSAADFGDFYQDEEAQSFCRSCPTRSRRYIGDGLGVTKSACQCLEGSKTSCTHLTG